MLAACGQRGDLYLPNTPEAAQRTRLPGVVFLPRQPVAPANAAPDAAAPPASAASAASAPAH